MFAAQGARTNPYKDFETLRAALELLRARRLLAIVLGEAGPEERIGEVTLRSEPFGGRGRVAETLRRADVYVHATKADNHPLAVLEALACGVPVIAARVGGIPEQLTDETGVLVEPGDPAALARAIGDLLADDERRSADGRGSRRGRPRALRPRAPGGRVSRSLRERDRLMERLRCARWPGSSGG